VTVRVTSLLEQGRATDALAVLPRHESCEHLECHLLRRRILTACGFEPMSPLPPARAVAHCALDVQVERLLAMAEQARRRDDDATAASLLESALRLAAPERLRLPFAEAGAEVTEMLAREEVLRKHRWIRPGPAETEAAEDADESVTAPHELTEAGEARETGDGGAEPAVPEPVDPLTAKEREVLGHLAALLTTEEIAATMFVSVNTVRSHVRSILRKLGVSRRNEAVRRAWDLHLLQPPPRSA
jgi:LuxR family maltose regulon positive regulatory protein